MRDEYVKDRKTRLTEKLDFISRLYDLAFETSDIPKTIKNLKQNLNFVANEKVLVENCRIIAEQIKVIKAKAKVTNKNFYDSLAERLIEVFKQIVDLIKSEFRTLRTRNDKLPRLDIEI